MTQRYTWNKRWRKRFPSKRYASKARYYAKHREHPANQRKSKRHWSAEDAAKITAADRPPDSVLARQLGRSVQAIQLKRLRLSHQK